MIRNSTALLALCWLIGSMPASSQNAPSRDLHLYNADLEMPSASGPSPGWAMWGADRYKDPRNYTRDTADPHGGSACLRVHHPAGSAGYLVTDPAHAIRPRSGMRYVITFWARADRSGEASFGFTAYSSISPFVDAPTPGVYPIQVGAKWHQFRFAIEEGRDFFADDSRFLLLTFDAARNHSEERTLYIDDLSATESPSANRHPLLNLNTIAHARLQHRLLPGPDLNLVVDAGTRLRKAAAMAGGVSFHRVVGWTGQPYDSSGRYTLDPRIEAAIRDMRLPMTRFYGVGAEPFGLEGSIDRVASLCKKVGIAEQNVVLELEEQSANRALPPKDWARAARYCRAKRYGFHYWEVANEPYSSLWSRPGAPSGQAFPTPQTYVAHLRAVSAAIHKVDSGAQIGVSIAPQNLPWGNQVLREAAGSYDFVVGHYYSPDNVNREGFQDLTLTANYRILDLILRVNALISAYNPKRSVYQLDTEWGMISSGPNGEEADYVPRNANVIGLVHRAVRLIYYTREGMLRGASSWQMLSQPEGPGFGILSQKVPDKRFLLYFLSYCFSRHVGEWVLPISGTSPFLPDSSPSRPGDSYAVRGPLTPVLATGSQDGRTVYLVIANGSWERSVPLRAVIRGFRAASASGVSLSQPSMDSSPLLDRKEDAVQPLRFDLTDSVLTGTIPAHSVVFVKISGRAI